MHGDYSLGLINRGLDSLNVTAIKEEMTCW